MTLKVVEPINVTDAVLSASDIPEPDTARGEVEFVPNRFEGYLLDRKSSVLDTKTIDAAIYQGFIYALEGFPRSESGLGGGYVHRYNLDGTYSGFSFTTLSFTTAIEVINDKIFTTTIGGFVQERDLAGVVINNHDIQPSVSSPVAICSNNSGGYNVLDSSSGQVVGFDSSFVANGFSLKIGEAGLQVYSLTNRNGYMYYVDQSAGKVVGITSESETFDEFKIVQTSDEPVFFGGLFFGATGEIYVLSRGDNRFYKYENGAYSAYYMPGDRVIKASNHLVYQCLIATGQDPAQGATEDAAATWIVVGPTNKWAMFDGIRDTKTLSDSEFTVTLNPTTYVNTLAVLGFSGVSEIRVEVDNLSGDTIYDKTYIMSDFSAIYDHYTYVFYQIVSIKKFIVQDLPPLPNNEIRVTFYGSNMAIGELIHGFAINVGQLVAENTKSDRFRYREQAYNDFGYPTGPTPITVELNTYDVLVGKLNNPAIQKLLDSITGENTLWVGDIGGGQDLVTYGFFERSPIPFAMPNHINYQITVRASV